MGRLGRDFFIGDTVSIARTLIGKYLVRRLQGETLVCRITETEAYVGATDKACHAYGYRRTRRNATMFGPPGHAYLYLIYGMYCCLNFVTNPEGEPDAVLLRGLVPVCGTERMAQRRFGRSAAELNNYQRKNFLNGPGKCCQALALDTKMDGLDLTGDTLFLCTSPQDAGLPAAAEPPFTVAVGRRIGIDYAQEAADFPWRFTWQAAADDKE